MTKQYDCIIVGAGIAGQTLARSLANTRIHVAILDSGTAVRDKSKDFLNEFISTEQSFRTDYLNRVRQIGGASNIWAGRLMRLTEEDLCPRPWLSSNGWPISYADLKKYYKEVDKEFKVEWAWENQQCKDVRYTPKARSTEYARSVWTKSIPRYGVKSKSWKQIRSNKQMEVFSNCTLIKVIDSGSNGIYANCVMDGKDLTLHTKIIVLATGGIENVRIMLDSHKTNGTYFSTDNANIGKYFMDHPKWISPALKLNNAILINRFLTKTYLNGSIKDGVKFCVNRQKELKVTNPYAEISLKMDPLYEEALARIISIYKSHSLSGTLKIKKGDISAAINTLYLINPSAKMPHCLRLGLQYVKNKFRLKLHAKSIVITIHLENSPSLESAIVRLPKKNRYGCSEIAVNWKVSDRDIESANALYKELVEGLIKENIVDRQYASELVTRDFITDASHHMGGTCMSRTESEGVVDKNLNYWGSRGIYIVGSSVFPTSGHANPTYTIVALSIRLGRHLRKIFGVEE